MSATSGHGYGLVLYCKDAGCVVLCVDVLQTHVFWVPSVIRGVFLDLDHDVRHQNHQQHDGTDAHPAHTPEQVRPAARHALDIITEPETQAAGAQSSAQTLMFIPFISLHLSHTYSQTICVSQT